MINILAKEWNIIFTDTCVKDLVCILQFMSALVEISGFYSGNKESWQSIKAKIADKSSNAPDDPKNQMYPHHLRMPKQHKHLITFMKGGFPKKVEEEKEAIDHNWIGNIFGP